MISIFNPDNITGQAFFQELLIYLANHDDVTLRQIKQEFSHVDNLDRRLDSYIQAGYIKREQKRYFLTLPLLDSLDAISLESHVMIDHQSPLYAQLLAMSFETVLANKTNQALIIESSSLTRDELTLANYFHKLRQAQPLSPKQKELFDLLGDVNPEYALKYMTSFLLKFREKAELVQKRADVFVDALVLLGYVTRAEHLYNLAMDFDQERLQFIKK